MGSVLLAGGRGTVTKLISGFIWHFINSPEDREFLQENPYSYSAAIAEMTRYLSPLPKIERLDVGEIGDVGGSVDGPSVDEHRECAEHLPGVGRLPGP